MESLERWPGEFGLCPVNKKKLTKDFGQRNNMLKAVSSKELILWWYIGWIKGKRTLEEGKCQLW